VQFAGHAAALEPDGYGENTCVAYIEHRRYTNGIGRPRIEALLVVTLGSLPPDRLCKLVTDISEPLAAKLHG
jgi:eukaryotic-like serine/threonine-protein kinase